MPQNLGNPGEWGQRALSAHCKPLLKAGFSKCELKDNTLMPKKAVLHDSHSRLVVEVGSMKTDLK